MYRGGERGHEYVFIFMKELQRTLRQDRRHENVFIICRTCRKKCAGEKG